MHDPRPDPLNNEFAYIYMFRCIYTYVYEYAFIYVYNATTQR